MKLSGIAFFLAFLLPCIVLAQNSSTPSREVTRQELEMKSLPQDREAEAVVLYDSGRSYFSRFQNRFDVIFERNTRIKVLTEAGVKYAEVEIPFYREGEIHERVYDVEAIAYNLEDGRITTTRLDISNIYTEKVNDWWNVRKFAIPNVRSGTVIEYRYKIISQHLDKLRDWSFQWRIPVVYSEYEVKLIPFFGYNYILQGATKFDSYTSQREQGITHQFGPVTYNNTIHKFVMRNLPAFREETYITSINDHIVKLYFQLSEIVPPNGARKQIITTWDKMNKDLLKHESFGKYIKQSAKSAKKELAIHELSPLSVEEKMLYIVDHVKQNYHWNKMYGKYAEKKFRNFKTSRHGNVANLNLFMVGLLRSVGLDAYGVIISTRDNGKIRSMDTPFSHYFNYVVAYVNVNGKTYLLDATDPLVPSELLPTRCINDLGLIVKSKEVQWLDFIIGKPSLIQKDIDISIATNGRANFTIKNQSTAYDAIYNRKTLGDDPENILKLVKDAGYEIAVEKPEIFNFQNISLPYEFVYSASTPVSSISGKLILPPFLNEPIRENPFKQVVRNYPVDYIYPEERVFNSTIQIPEGYSVEFIPENAEFDNALLSFSYKASEAENTITVTGKYTLKKSIYQPSEYSSLKNSVGEVIKKLNQEIVLREDKSLTEVVYSLKPE